jgi:hypothetical protein
MAPAVIRNRLPWWSDRVGSSRSVGMKRLDGWIAEIQRLFRGGNEGWTAFLGVSESAPGKRSSESSI